MTEMNLNNDNNNEKKDKMKKMIKRGAGLGLCAVLAGGLAAGAYEGVNRLTGWNQPAEVAAAEDAKLTLTKKEKAEDDKTTSDTEKSENKKDGGTEVKGYLDVSDIAQEAMPSVVSITTKSIQEVEDYYGMFLYGYGYEQPEAREVQGSGSGIIIGKNDDELLIATNYHVVEGANTLSVCFVDDEVYEASMKGFDEGRDLAVVSVPLEDIDDETMEAVSVAKIGSSDDLVVGEQVVAIGNALGYGQSVTTGIVSAKNRRMNSESGTFQTDDEENRRGLNLIQTDAAINPGNSGGALLNMDGEVVGINSAKLASTEVEGMGYAIAISDVEEVLEQMMNEEPREQLGDGEHGVLGITAGVVTEEGIQLYGIPEGAYVADVTEGGAADEAGIVKNSVITEFDGKSISSPQQLVDRLSYYAPGEEVEVTVLVRDGNEYKEETVTVTLQEDPEAEKKTANKENSDADENLVEDWADGQEEEGNSSEEDSSDGFRGFFGDWK